MESIESLINFVVALFLNQGIRTLPFVMIIVVLSIVIGMLVMWNMRSKKSLPPTTATPNPEVIYKTILVEIKHMLEVGVVRKDFKSVVHFSDVNTNKIPIFGEVKRPFSKREFTLEYVGTIVCGCDLDMVKVYPDGNDARVIVPHSRILHAYVDQESVKVHQQSKQIFSSGVKLEEQNREIMLDLKSNQENAIREGLLTQADESVRGMIASIVEGKGLKARIEFVDSGHPLIAEPSTTKLLI